MKEFIQNLLGTYSPVTYTVGEDTIVASGLAGVDWLYVISGLLFVVIVYSIFRIIGGLICKTS